MSIDEPELPTEPSLLSAYPNPFNSSTIIKYPNNEGGELEIYNLIGQLVKALRISLTSGQIVWDGTDNQNNSVPSGVYFARIKATGIGSGAKLLLLR
jgi:flagellar hook assembly protein FlgD